MRILFLDDDDERYSFFRQRNIGRSVDRATTAAGAVALLRENAYDRIYLDHDLTEQHYLAFARAEPVDERTTGMAVAKYLAGEGRPRHRGTTIVVHSANRGASNAMGDVLRSAQFNVVVKAGGWATE